MRWILQKLLGLDESVLKPDADITFRLAQAWPLWILLLVLLSVVVYAGVIYYKEGRPVGLGMRTFLAALRVGVLVMLILLLCEPILAVEEVELTKPYVVFMIDTSQSMNLKDRFPEEEDVQRARDALPEEFSFEGKPRADLEREDLQKLARIDFVNEFLRGEKTDPRKSSLAQRYRLRFYEFAKDIRPKYAKGEAGGGPTREIVAGSSEALGTETRIGDSMRKVLNELRGQSVAGLVIFTDGRSNAGDNPVEAARIAAKRSVPIFPVGVGDRKIFDVEVKRVEAPERAFSGDYVSFEATLEQKGYAGEKAKVVLKRGTETVDSKDVEFPGDGKSFRVPLRHKPDTPGKADYKVVIEGRTGELVTDNNSRSHTLNVVEGKIKVLYVEGENLPRWEYRFLKHAMMRDRTLQVSTLLAQPDRTWFYDGNYEVETYPDTEKAMFDKYNVIIFGDIDPQFFNEKQLKLTARFVEEGGGFMMIAGERYAPVKYVGKKNPIRALIPVVVDPADDAILEMGKTITRGFKPLVTAAGQESKVLRLENDVRANVALWNKTADQNGLPPFFWYLPVPKAKATATVLLRHPKDKASGQDQTRPLLVVGRYGEGLTMFVGTDEFWRWRFGHGDRYFYRFYAQAIQYLASGRGGKSKLSILRCDRPVYSLGEPVKLTAEIKVSKGDKYEPFKGETVTVIYQIEGLGEQPPLKLKKVPGSPGTFEGRLIPKGRGKFHAWLKPVDTTSVKKKGGECDFEVKLPQLEYEDPRMDEKALRKLAEAGAKGGRFLFADEAHKLPVLITEPERRDPVITEHPLWDNWRLFVLFTLVIGAEWILRKRVRMM